MGLYKNRNGVLDQIAGRGHIGYGASAVRNGVLTGIEVGAGGSGFRHVSFDSDMEDNEYMVVLFPSETGDRKISCYPNARNVSGFNIIYSNMGSTALTNFTIEWYAFKVYTDIQYNSLMDCVPEYASTDNKLATDDYIIQDKTVISVRASSANTLYEANVVDYIGNVLNRHPGYKYLEAHTGKVANTPLLATICEPVYDNRYYLQYITTKINIDIDVTIVVTMIRDN